MFRRDKGIRVTKAQRRVGRRSLKARCTSSRTTLCRSYGLVEAP